jgi:hypothetical protein
MERRDWSLKLLSELIYIDSLDSYEKADALVVWHNDYFKNNTIESLDLNIKELENLEELFFRNLNFLKEQQNITCEDMKKIKKMKSFLKN